MTAIAEPITEQDRILAAMNGETPFLVEGWVDAVREKAGVEINILKDYEQVTFTRDEAAELVAQLLDVLEQTKYVV